MKKSIFLDRRFSQTVALNVNEQYLTQKYLFKIFGFFREISRKRVFDKLSKIIQRKLFEIIRRKILSRNFYSETTFRKIFRQKNKKYFSRTFFREKIISFFFTKIFSRKNYFIFFHENIVIFEKKNFAKSFPKNSTKKMLSDNFRDPRFSKILTKNFSRNIFSRKFSRNVIFRENFFSINSYRNKIQFF